MKALQLVEANRLEYTEVPEPSFGDEDVLIQVKACGICGSDVHGLDGSTGRRQPPLIMGHEASGIIAGVGSGVSGWAEGDRVTFDSTIYCGHCRYCRQGRINLCEDRRVLGVSCDDYRREGAMAEYVAVPQHILYRLPETVGFEQGAMIEALSTAVHAVHRTSLHLNDTAVVVGAGVIGLLVVQVLRASGCGMIVAVDIDRSRLDLARELGADVVLQAGTQEIVSEVLTLTKGRGADCAFEVAGYPDTFKTAAAVLCKGAQLTLVGNLSTEVILPLQAVVTREISMNGSCASCGEYPACLDMIERGSINVDRLISASVPLAEGASWFARLVQSEPGLIKVSLKP
ncbi:MAG: galactitol-1-phosphate 5-dehydrogenase [Sedimentisphaerales bacterium]|nr:galactitol-1-phosphate 5-dehydrogenase [Sedimentisphaerales bacterium]